MSELKPCPFCGSENVVRLPYNDRADIERCKNCNLTIIVPLGYTMWNTRPIEDALNARIAELEAERRWRIVANGELPEENADCLVAFMTDPKYATVCTAYLSGRSKCWEIDGLHYGDVTHWMPAPELPKESEK